MKVNANMFELKYFVLSKNVSCVTVNVQKHRHIDILEDVVNTKI